MIITYQIVYTSLHNGTQITVILKFTVDYYNIIIQYVECGMWNVNY